MAERISRRKVVFGGIAALSGLAVVALVGCESKDGKVKKTPTPPKTPKATETIAPTATPTPIPTEAPTVAPTEVPVEAPATIDDVRNAFFGENGAYSKLSDATIASLPHNQSQAYIEEQLGVCNGEIAIPDNPPRSSFSCLCIN